MGTLFTKTWYLVRLFVLIRFLVCFLIILISNIILYFYRDFLSYYLSSVLGIYNYFNKYIWAVFRFLYRDSRVFYFLIYIPFIFPLELFWNFIMAFILKDFFSFFFLRLYLVNFFFFVY